MSGRECNKGASKVNLNLIAQMFLPCGADVVYDPDVAVSLVELLSKILRCSSAEVFICSTIRNPETYRGFKQQLGKTPLRR